MNIVAGQPVRGSKLGDALAKGTLLSLQLLGTALFGRELHQEALHEGGHRRISFRSDDARTPINGVIE